MLSPKLYSSCLHYRVLECFLLPLPSGAQRQVDADNPLSRFSDSPTHTHTLQPSHPLSSNEHIYLINRASSRALSYYCVSACDFSGFPGALEQATKLTCVPQRTNRASKGTGAAGMHASPVARGLKIILHAYLIMQSHRTSHLCLCPSWRGLRDRSWLARRCTEQRNG